MQYVKISFSSFERVALRLSFAVVFVLVCCTAGLKAQTGSTPGATETRARRAPATSGTATVGETTTNSRVKDGNASKSEVAGQDETGRSVASKRPQNAAKPDRVSVLRAQIVDAKTGTERVRLQRTLVDYLIALGRNEEAAIELRAMLSTEGLDAGSYYNIGNGLARLGETEQSVTAYRKAIDSRQGNYPRALNNMGVVLFDLGRLDEAFDAFVLAIKQQNFRYAEASYNLGKLYAARNEEDLAISEWTRALKVEPGHVDAAVALARAYAITGKPGLGLEVLERTLKRTGANDRLEAARDEISSISPRK